MADARQLLKQVFGFDAFRPGQEDIVEAVAGGQDTLAIMPTGGGKSLCYQLPALLRPGTTLVISPLIALMRDQVRALNALGVKAAALTSAHTPDEVSQTLDALMAGDLSLLYMAPERLATASTGSLLRRAHISLIAVDEAHCVSQWGHDFRPDYLAIGPLRQALDVPLAAFTATADEETRAEIIERLFPAPPKVVLQGFDRPNIRLAFQPKDQPRRQILEFAAARKGLSGIVYCATRAKTETLAAALNAEGHTAMAYHGGMEAEARKEVETRFQLVDDMIVVATVAFGMGVDKPDIRWVAQADLPKSIEAYYQEIGRAGRDGAPADSLTLYGPDDIRLRRAQIDEGLAPPERRAADHGRLNALLGLAEAQGCRRQILLGYFGEASEPCGNCDHCDAPPELFDGTEAAQMVMSAALRTGEWFGAGHLIDVLTGTVTDKVRARGHDALPTFGVGRAFDRRGWQAVVRQMLALDLLRPDPTRHGALRLTDAARPVLRGETTVTMRKDALARKGRQSSAARALVGEDAAPILAQLKAKRRELAEAARAPAYVIFNDKTLIEMAETAPKTLDDMARVGGVGAKKLERYGQVFLEVINGEAPEVHPLRRAIAGQDVADTFDRLRDAARELERGRDGLDKPMSLSTSLLARVARLGAADAGTLAQLLGQRRFDRFGDSFLEILRGD